jgi:tryptophan 2,3-dioxygenase
MQQIIYTQVKTTTSKDFNLYGKNLYPSSGLQVVEFMKGLKDNQ